MVTLKDIALKAGVSRATAGLILSGEGTATRFTSTTRERVATAARDLGYRPNSSAKAISTGRFGCIALLSSTRSNDSVLPLRLMDGIQEALNTHDLHLMHALIPDEKLTEQGFMPKFLREWMVDGLLINSVHNIPPKLLDIIKQGQTPLVWLNVDAEEDCVQPDDVVAGRQATEQLIALGHRRIAYAVYRTGHYSACERYEGYRQAMAAVGLEPWRVERHVGIEGWVTQARQLLEKPDRPTAIVAYEAFPAQPILYAALTLGLRVPEDLSIVTFHGGRLEDRTIGRFFGTWLIPNYEMGRCAVEMLLAKIENPAQPRPIKAVPFTYLPGETLAPPPRDHTHH